MENSYDLVVIGSGPAGEVGAIRAAQLGLKVALIEKSEHLGGTCLNVGCIPTKALLESAKTFDKLQSISEQGFKVPGTISYDWDIIQKRKDTIVDQQRKGLKFLMNKNKITVYHGHGRIQSKSSVVVTDTQNKTTSLTTKKILLCTGSRVRELPNYKADGKRIHTSDTILFIKEVPKSLLVIGGGIVGMEFASCFGRFGTQVTVIELAPRILPTEDGEVVKEFTRQVQKQNVVIETTAKLNSLKVNANDIKVSIEGKEEQVFTHVLVAIGREPVTEDCGLASVNLKTEKGFIAVDKNYRTACDSVYAVGDIIATPALAHTASAEAIHAVEHIAGHHPPLINYEANPSAVYAYPEIASIGYSEEKLKAENKEYKVSKFPFAPMAKAKIEGATQGFVKILYEPKFKEILGVHIIGARATEMIAEFSLGKILETTVDEIGHTIHPHPTISETIMEAAHAAMGGAIHL